MMEIDSLVLLAFLWLLWCVVHSILIATSWSRLMQRLMGSRYAYYRFTYILFSVVSFAGVYYFERGLPETVYFDWLFPFSIFRYALLIAAILFFYLGARQYDQSFFLGLRQIRDHLDGRGSDFSGFSTEGILRRVRHPYYTGGILFLLAWGDVTSGSIVSKSVMIAYLVVGTLLEEKKLLTEFGELYREYQRAVPMFIPSLTRKPSVLPREPVPDPGAGP